MRIKLIKIFKNLVIFTYCFFYCCAYNKEANVFNLNKSFIFVIFWATFVVQKNQWVVVIVAKKIDI